MKTIYLYLLDTMADWEVGYAVAELNTGRFLKNKEWRIKTCATTRKPVTTLGGVTLQPDVTVEGMEMENTAMLLLPGADVWVQNPQQAILSRAKAYLKVGIPVAAICGATAGLAQAGMLDKTTHTSNGLQYLQLFCPAYKGAEHYVDELAVTDGNLITAGSSAPVEFAYHIFKKLEAFTPEKLEWWYGYFGRHNTQDMLQLLQSQTPN